MLYFGQAAFWSAFRATGDDPRADLAAAGPQHVGRFDLERERLLPPLDVTAEGARSGVWDVHAHPNGRVYFTTFFESMGAVDPATGAVARFPELGLGLNEIAPAPGGNLLVTRYGAAGARDPRTGSLVLVSPEGELLDEYPLEPPPGFSAAPKTPAWDAQRREYWATNDLIPLGGGHVETDAYVLDAEGAALRRIAQPEVQFVAALPDGGVARVERADDGLWLVLPGEPPRRTLLDPEFRGAHDFAQDLKPAAAGRSVTTRWSGWVHVAAEDGSVRSMHLPSLAEGGLYYTAVLHGERVCATYCAEVQVVCADAP